MNLTIIATKSLLSVFDKLDNCDEAIRHLLKFSINDFVPQWFVDNAKLVSEGQKQHVWPAGLDCVNWPELRLVARDGSYFVYPIDLIPVAPHYCFICSSNDPNTIPGKENSLYYADYPECMDTKIKWYPFQLFAFAIKDGMHKTKVKI